MSVVRRLPKQPNLEHLRNQAKDLLRDFRGGDSAALAIVAAQERGAAHKAEAASFALSDAQRILARSYGFPSWPKLKAFVDGATIARFAAAVERQDAVEVAAMLRSRPELVHMDMSENNERRAIHFAVLNRDVPMVRTLMAAGSNARKGIYPHRDATTAFALARDRGYTDVVAAIEEEESRRKPASEPSKEEVAEQAVESAIKAGDADSVRKAVAENPGLLREISTNGGLLTYAVNARQLEMVRLLLDLGADVNERILLPDLETPTESWGMPLWHAARNGDFAISKLLLDRGADANANVYASGWPLRNAWNHPDPAVKNLLLAHGAHVEDYMVAENHDVAEARRRLADSPTEHTIQELLWSACDHGCPEIVELALPLIRWPRNHQRWHWVMIQPVRGAHDGSVGHYQCMQALLRHGVDPNIARSGATVLHFAAASHTALSNAERARFAALLLDHGASLAVRDDLLKSTPLGWACRWGRFELAKLLLERGSPAHEPDAEPWATPLAWATKMNHGDILALLSTA